MARESQLKRVIEHHQELLKEKGEQVNTLVQYIASVVPGFQLQVSLKDSQFSQGTPGQVPCKNCAPAFYNLEVALQNKTVECKALSSALEECSAQSSAIKDAVHLSLRKIMDGGFEGMLEKRLEQLEKDGELREKEIADLRVKLRQKEMQLEIVMMDIKR